MSSCIIIFNASSINNRNNVRTATLNRENIQSGDLKKVSSCVFLYIPELRGT